MIQKNLIKALIGLIVFIVLMVALGILFEEEMALGTAWVVDRIGFWGLAGILLVTDTLVTPFPPDILLVIISKTHLAENWPIYVGILGCVSVIAGMTGYSIGRWLGHFQWSKRLFGQFEQEHHDFIQKYGFWAVAIGSATPLPYSVTCWTAGVLNIRWTTVLLASILFRVPRIYAYYWLLTSAKGLFN